MKKTLLTIGLFFALAVCAHADSLKCLDGNDLLLDRDSVVKVVECLGQPLYKDVKYEVSRDRDGTITKTPVEQWYYSINGWSYAVVIKNGRVISITDLGRN